MFNLRKYGKPPYTVAVIHGGPGAGGGMAPIAVELSTKWGILEPIQTKTSITGQIEELKQVLESHRDDSMTLIGSSWGAWLITFLAAEYPDLVKKLILVGAGPYDEKYTKEFQANRLSRLSVTERAEFQKIINFLANPFTEGKEKLIKRLGELASKTDDFDPIDLPHDPQEIPFNADIYAGVWPQAVRWRKNGKLIELASKVQCPVVAIHGDYDPHPAEGVKLPLSNVVSNFQFYLLEKCGHEPWKEKHARQFFFEILLKELDK